MIYLVERKSVFVLEIMPPGVDVGIDKSEFSVAAPQIGLTAGEVIRTLGELKEWTQGEPARRRGISAANLSALENDRFEIGRRRAGQLARAFNVHPSIIIFPEYESSGGLKAA